MGFAGLVAEALFREIAVARADAPDGVEFVVTLQVLADVIVAPAGPGAARSPRAPERECADARGFFRARRPFSREDARGASGRARGGLRRRGSGRKRKRRRKRTRKRKRPRRAGGGRRVGGGGVFLSRRVAPDAPARAEDVDDAFRNSSAFFVENAVEIVVDTIDTCRACLARAFRGVARMEAEMASPTTSPTAAYAGERAHVLARFDVLTRRFANATNDATTVSTFEDTRRTHGNAVPESGLIGRTNDDLDDDDESAVLPFSETRASLTVCDFAGTGGNRVPDAFRRT